MSTTIESLSLRARVVQAIRAQDAAETALEEERETIKRRLAAQELSEARERLTAYLATVGVAPTEIGFFEPADDADDYGALSVYADTGDGLLIRTGRRYPALYLARRCPDCRAPIAAREALDRKGGFAGLVSSLRSVWWFNHLCPAVAATEEAEETPPERTPDVYTCQECGATDTHYMYLDRCEACRKSVSIVRVFAGGGSVTEWLAAADLLVDQEDVRVMPGPGAGLTVIATLPVWRVKQVEALA